MLQVSRQHALSFGEAGQTGGEKIRNSTRTCDLEPSSHPVPEFDMPLDHHVSLRAIGKALRKELAHAPAGKAGD